MAVACATANLLAQRALGVDLVMLVEGEEEAGSGKWRLSGSARYSVYGASVICTEGLFLQETIGPIDTIFVRYVVVLYPLMAPDLLAATPRGWQRTHRVSHMVCEA